ncbi:MAG: asparagine synthase C-terminal domain-containing protein [Halobacteriota archaeon]
MVTDRPGSIVDGADAELVTDAIDRGDPLPGTSGFAGSVEHSTRGRVLVRDVLGRRPLYSDRDSVDPAGEGAFAFDPTALSDPIAVPPGSIRTAEGDESIWTLPDPPVLDPSTGVDAVSEALLSSVRSIDPEGTAVAFSGGVDSALVAAGVPDAPCYVVGFAGSHDIDAATAAAAAMDRAVTVVELTHDDLERAVPIVARAIGRTNPMDVSIAVPLYLVGRTAAADGYDRLALGQGADELFGGYSKHVDPATDHRVEAQTVRGAVREVMGTLPEQLERDVLAIRAAGVEPVTPILHDRVVETALSLPESLLATPAERKVALRRVAGAVLPASIVAAEKKALQYGTYVNRELDRLARQAGFKRRMDDHVGQYVRSLLQ